MVLRKASFFSFGMAVKSFQHCHHSLPMLCVPGLTDLESKRELGASLKARSPPLCPPGGFRSHHIASAGINHVRGSHFAP